MNGNFHQDLSASAGGCGGEAVPSNTSAIWKQAGDNSRPTKLGVLSLTCSSTSLFLYLCFFCSFFPLMFIIICFLFSLAPFSSFTYGCFCVLLHRVFFLSFSFFSSLLACAFLYLCFSLSILFALELALLFPFLLTPSAVRTHSGNLSRIRAMSVINNVYTSG